MVDPLAAGDPRSHYLDVRARGLLSWANSGGSNGNRLRAWKLHLQEFADRLGFPTTACHYPSGVVQGARRLAFGSNPVKILPTPSLTGFGQSYKAFEARQ